MNLEKIREEISEHALEIVIHRSVLCYPSSFSFVDGLLEANKPKKILEIGTYNCVSALVFARYPFVERIWTLDIVQSPVIARLRRHLDHERKITPLLVKGNVSDKSAIVGNLNCDFAFIDGDHTYEGVSVDIEVVIPKIPNVLFHDAKEAGVKKALDELEAKGTHNINRCMDFAFARKI